MPILSNKNINRLNIYLLKYIYNIKKRFIKNFFKRLRANMFKTFSSNSLLDNTYENVLEKITLRCNCIISKELDISNNSINKRYLQICKNHYCPKLISKNEYIYIKSKKIYVYKKYTLNKRCSQSSSSSEELNDDDEQMDNNIIDFGKYKNKSYKFVFNIDKKYCYHLSFWKKNNYQENVNKFVSYVKQKI